LFAGANSGLYRSTDEGATWEKFGHGIPISSIQEITVASDDPKHVIVAASAGLYESVDGGAHYSRIEEGPGMEDLPIQLLAVHPLNGNPILAGSAYNGLFAYHSAEPAAESPTGKQAGNFTGLDAKAAEVKKDPLTP
jgi:photosystem II stability/assembly factor-like uncharacterized protein